MHHRAVTRIKGGGGGSGQGIGLGVGVGVGVGAGVGVSQIWRVCPRPGGRARRPARAAVCVARSEPSARASRHRASRLQRQGTSPPERFQRKGRRQLQGVTDAMRATFSAPRATSAPLSRGVKLLRTHTQKIPPLQSGSIPTEDVGCYVPHARKHWAAGRDRACTTRHPAPSAQHSPRRPPPLPAGT